MCKYTGPSRGSEDWWGAGAEGVKEGAGAPEAAAPEAAAPDGAPIEDALRQPGVAIAPVTESAMAAKPDAVASASLTARD
jgi:hypothetical protein